MLGIGSTEFVIILVFGFLLFGPDKLPQMGHTIGRALRQFRETQEKLTAVVQTEVVDPMAAAAKKPMTSDAAASSHDDEDADAPASATEPARKVTFAERRARLAAERAEQEAAKAAAEENADATSDDTTSASASVEEPQAETKEETVEESAPLTTEDLYARRPRKRKAAEATEAADDSATSADASKGGEQ